MESRLNSSLVLFVANQVLWNLRSKTQCAAAQKASIASKIVGSLRSPRVVSLAISNKNSPIHSPFRVHDDLNEKVNGEEVHAGASAFEVAPVADQVDEGKVDYQMMQ